MLIFWCGKKTGMAFGSGNAVGHRIADAVFGPRVFKHEVQGADPAPSAASCAASMTAFQEVYMLISDSFSVAFAC